jgi:catechol 2,3-dioxygenase-like lactoylglutathione lyase family enzyme
MITGARYGHTNIVAADWKRLVRFYVDVLGCVAVPPERHYKGENLERGTGVAGAEVRGAHLRLPGHGDNGPTLEIFTYSTLADRPPTAANRPGFGHIAFMVDDVQAARAEVLAAGGRAVGDVVTLTAPNGARVTWTYVTDPEGNIIELQTWKAP